MKKFLAISFAFISINSFSQTGENYVLNPTKNSFGLDYRFENFRGPNIGLTYRRYFESSYNLRANFSLGSNDNFSGFWNNGNLLIHETNDSAIPLIGVHPNNSRSTSYQRIELGLEKQLSVWKINFIAGIDLFAGHKVMYEYNSVSQMEEVQTVQNGILYKQYQIVGIDSNIFDNSLNRLDAQQNYLLLGANFRFGTKINLSNRLFTTAFLSYRLEQNLLINERIDYNNETYKEHMPKFSGGNYFSANWFYSIGLNYRF